MKYRCIIALLFLLVLSVQGQHQMIPAYPYARVGITASGRVESLDGRIFPYCVAWLGFPENNTDWMRWNLAPNKSGYAEYGTYPSWSADGDGSAYFYSNGYTIGASDTNWMLDADDFVFSVWIKPDSTNAMTVPSPAGAQWAPLMYIHGGPGSNRFTVCYTAAYIKVYGNAAAAWHETGVKISEGVWQNVMAIRTNGTVVLYLNGVRSWQVAWPAYIWSGKGNVSHIGIYPQWGCYPGLMDDWLLARHPGLDPAVYLDVLYEQRKGRYGL